MSPAVRETLDELIRALPAADRPLAAALVLTGGERGEAERLEPVLARMLAGRSRVGATKRTRPVFWTRERRDLLISLACAGHRSTHIAQDLGVSPNAVVTQLTKERTLGADIPYRHRGNGRPWTDAEDAALLDALDRGLTQAAAGAEIGRSHRAVTKRVGQLRAAGQKLASTRPRWSADEVKRLIEMAGRPHAEIAAALGRTSDAVYNRMLRLRRGGVLPDPASVPAAPSPRPAAPAPAPQPTPRVGAMIAAKRTRAEIAAELGMTTAEVEEVAAAERRELAVRPVLPEGPETYPGPVMKRCPACKGYFRTALVRQVTCGPCGAVMERDVVSEPLGATSLGDAT